MGKRQTKLSYSYSFGCFRFLFTLLSLAIANNSSFKSKSKFELTKHAHFSQINKQMNELHKQKDFNFSLLVSIVCSMYVFKNNVLTQRQQQCLPMQKQNLNTKSPCKLRFNVALISNDYNHNHNHNHNGHCVMIILFFIIFTTVFYHVFLFV